jgi:hypothetical protein
MTWVWVAGGVPACLAVVQMSLSGGTGRYNVGGIENASVCSSCACLAVCTWGPRSRHPTPLPGPPYSGLDLPERRPLCYMVHAVCVCVCVCVC